ncbi:2Fe-2S iron-sulfur cluster-binding protein [Litorivicinus sp.]|nr:2Fe-2S iron-sulfur cluster-binding protein [Litorivicinus sp.]
MLYVTFIDPSENEIEANFEPGDSLLQAAVHAGVDGILAECGGGCSCATCHVILSSAWAGTLEPPGPQEADMLTFAVDPTPQSRLACQVQLKTEHNGLTLNVAKRQY